MKKLKKLLCFLLCGSIVLSGGLLLNTDSVFAEESETPEAVVYGKDDLELVNAFGITDYEEENLAEPLTRGEFFKIACALDGITGTGSAADYRDLPDDHEFAPYIAALSDMGVISGDEHRFIHPDEQISLMEASAVVLRLAGYSIIAEEDGGYPSGYQKAGTDNELYDNLGSDMSVLLTKGMAVQLAANALDMTVMVKEYTTNPDSYRLYEGGTLLTQVFRADHAEDVVNAVDISRLSGENDTRPFFIQVGDGEYEIHGKTDIYDYLGYRVDLYYYLPKGAKAAQVVYIKKSAENREVVIDNEDITDIDSTSVKMTDENNRKRSYSYIKGVPVIYNGAATKEGLSISMLEETYKVGEETKTKRRNGSLRLVDNNGDNKFDVAFADVYNNYAVSQVDSLKMTIYDKYNTSKTIVLDTEADDPYTIIYDTEGEETTLGSVTTDMIVSVYQSAPDAYQQYIRVYMNAVAAEGVISKVRDNKKYITVNDKEYRVNEEVIANQSDKLEAGAAVVVYTDIYGRVAYLGLSAETDYAYAFVMAMANKKSGFSTSLSFKLYLPDGTFEELYGANKMTVDGEKYTDKENDVIINRLHSAAVEVFGSSVGESGYNQMIRYKKNGAGEITAIDTVISGTTGIKATRGGKHTNDDTLFMSSSGTSNNYFYVGYLNCGPNISMTRTTPIMMHPTPGSEDMLDELLYQMTVPTDVQSDTAMNWNAFYSKATAIAPDVITWAGGMSSSEIKYTNRLCVINNVIKMIDENTGEEITGLEILSNTGTVTLPVNKGLTFSGADNEAAGLKPKMTADDLRFGDVVRYQTNKNGYLSNLILYYRSETDTKVTTGQTAYNASLRIIYGYVYDKLDNGFVFYQTDSSDKSVLQGIDYENCELINTLPASTTYYITEDDVNGKKAVKASSYQNMKSYKDTGMACSRIIMHQRAGLPESVFIIE